VSLRPDSTGNAAVETYSITGKGHGRRAEQCGTAGSCFLDVNLCAAYRLGRAWGLG
jgi:poly(3-hydroxybutyrate) depolymerase